MIYITTWLYIAGLVATGLVIIGEEDLKVSWRHVLILITWPIVLAVISIYGTAVWVRNK